MADAATKAAMKSRTEARKAAHVAANDARETANVDRLAEIGGRRQHYNRVTMRLMRNDKGGYEWREHTRVKLESPGTALARTLRERAGRIPADSRSTEDS